MCEPERGHDPQVENCCSKLMTNLQIYTNALLDLRSVSKPRDVVWNITDTSHHQMCESYHLCFADAERKRQMVCDLSK